MEKSGATGKTVVAIDPAFRNLGWVKASIRDYPGRGIPSIEIIASGTFRTKAGASKKKRKSSDDFHSARNIAGYLRAITQDCDFVISEIPSGSQSARASWTLGIALGTLSVITKPIVEVTPSMTKFALTGDKTASKRQIIDAAYKLHPEAMWERRKMKGKMTVLNKNEHMADAIAVLYAGLQAQKSLSVSSSQKSSKKSKSSDKFSETK